MTIHSSTAFVLEKFSEQVNSSGPKRVQWKDIVDYAVSKVIPADIEKLRQHRRPYDLEKVEQWIASQQEKAEIRLTEPPSSGSVVQ